MNRYLIWFFRILFVVNIGVIFYLTFQSREETLALSEHVRDVAAQTVTGSASVQEVRSSWWYNMGNFRRLAHLPEYFALGCTGLLAAMTFRSGKRCCLYAWLSCLGVSCVDQTMKYYLPTREFSLADMGVDLFGYTLGVLLIFTLSGIISRS